MLYGVFFFNDTATTEIYTLSLHDALPISMVTRIKKPASQRSSACIVFSPPQAVQALARSTRTTSPHRTHRLDRKSTRLNSSHANISYAVFCLKKKKY